MSNARPSWSQRKLTEALECLQRDYGKLHDVTDVDAIVWRDRQTTPIYRIRTADGDIAIKLVQPKVSVHRWVVQAAFGSMALRNQAIFLNSLEGTVRDSRVGFRTPRLLATDRRSYLAMEYVDGHRRPWGDWDRQQMADALVNLQSLGGYIKYPKHIVSPLLRRSRCPDMRVRRAIHACEPLLGRNRLRALAALQSRCIALQPPLDRYLVVHNDFHHNNILWDVDGRLWIIDFEGAALHRRWAMVDATSLAVATKSVEIDWDFLRTYLDRLRYEPFWPMINVTAQMRFGMLGKITRLIGSAVSTSEVKEWARAFIDQTLLDDRSWDQWIEAHAHVAT